jgi:hypothetical protein
MSAIALGLALARANRAVREPSGQVRGQERRQVRNTAKLA